MNSQTSFKKKINYDADDGNLNITMLNSNKNQSIIDFTYSDKELTLSVSNLLDSESKRDLSLQQLQNHRNIVNNDDILNFQDIITDKDALDFLKKHFNNHNYNVSKISIIEIQPFVNTLFQEFLIRYPNIISQTEDYKAFTNELKAILQRILVTSNENYLSLNALEVHTKNKGLYNFVLELCTEVNENLNVNQNNEIQQAILEEFDAVKKILDQRKKELVAYEERLKEFADDLENKQNKMKSVLEFEYKGLISSFESVYKEKINNMQKKYYPYIVLYLILKRLVAVEKDSKIKIKLLESKFKEIKEQSNNKANNEEKLKTKIHTIEKNNEFLKMKVVDSEKKLAAELELKANSLAKNTKLQQKITTLEKSMKDLQDSKSQLLTPKPGTNEFMTYLSPSFSEKPLEMIDLNTSHTVREATQRETTQRETTQRETTQREQLQNQRSLEEDYAHYEEKLNESNINLKSSSVGRSLSKKLLTNENMAGKKKIISKTTSSTNDEIKVLLGIIHSMIICLKSTLPVFINGQKNLTECSIGLNENLGLEDSRVEVVDHSQQTFMIDEDENQIDLGEIFYPCVNNLTAQIIEITPLLNKQYNIQHLFSVIEMFYKLINFVLKFKMHHIFPEDEINQAKRNKYYNDFSINQTINKCKNFSIRDYLTNN